MITGAASGIGKSTTLRLVERGFRIIAIGRSGKNLDCLTRQSNAGCITPCLLGLADTEAIKPTVEKPISDHENITQLVNNAGVWAGDAITHMTNETWRLNFAVNATVPFALMRTVAPAMAETDDGAITTVSSPNAYRSSTGNSAYDALKAAILALTRTAAGEFTKYKHASTPCAPGLSKRPVIRVSMTHNSKQLIRR